MNYRHIYHAGNFADVIKHLMLIQTIEHLKQKETPFFVLDTHAGIGIYDLTSEQAQKTHEADAGIQQLMQHPLKHPIIEQYLSIIRSFNPAGTNIHYYPGSPALTSYLLRPQDRFIANELHPEDHLTLRKTASRLPMLFKVLNTDASIALKAHLPPKENRGLVLIDPPFEEKDEFEFLIENLKQALKRWRTGVYMIWFPLKLHLPILEFYKEITALNIPKTWLLETWVKPIYMPESFNGCGIIILNTPWKLDTDFEGYSASLQNALLPKPSPGFKTEWLVT